MNQIVELNSSYFLTNWTGVNREGGYRQWFMLLKPKVLTLVVFTGACGISLAPGHLSPFLSFISILCITSAAGACGAINMWFDRDIDAIMRRTCSRPIPSGNIPPNQVLAFGIILAAGSVLLMGLALNLIAALILTFSIIFYTFIYTIWLKRRTSQNIVIGGAAGAFPPIIGWVSVTGDISLMPMLMFGIIFIWTPPHFWSLALWANDDYKRADVPMLPVTNGELYTRQIISYYTILLVVISLFPLLTGIVGVLYMLVTSLLGLKYVIHAYKIVNDKQDKQGRSLYGDGPAKEAFRYSIWYLFSLFGILVIDKLLK